MEFTWRKRPDGSWRLVRAGTEIVVGSVWRAENDLCWHYQIRWTAGWSPIRSADSLGAAKRIIRDLQQADPNGVPNV